jgi:trehalose/maltose hydrolase-like predicted phosphorylase
MARWNLRRAAAEPGVTDEERRRWLGLAEAIVDGYHAENGLYEQFAGFFELEPLIAAEIAPRRPYPGEILLPMERLHHSQVVKQTDVLMLHHLVPDEVAPGSLEPNLAFYEPRTTHGSSLSPAIHASLFARVGRFDDALSYLRMSALLDLDNITGSTRSGLHLATMGGVWQTLAFGFAGLRAVGGTLTVDPRVPPALDALEVRVRFRGTPVAVRASADELELRTQGRLAASVPGHGQVELDGSARFRRDGDGWRNA